ncbi:DUF317 domain-containing protein [Kitasatospora phosalacinea]|uniref:DUF317 domain-containing protein n=1 Tax=Kitasatospora phosalacinea TaxID=2065 RepID=A0A9W6PKY9_9ACTN|nr:DUF317 domain-containing protein [Kitasatospora phosalacinea]GLW58205.1 hypothetical protein Kpho01_62160 [Kitasatospora phosalacinea]
MIERQDWFQSSAVAVGPRHFIGPLPGAGDLLADFLTDRGWQRPRDDRLLRPCGRLGVHLPRGSNPEWTVWGAQHRGAQVAWSLTAEPAVPTELLAAAITEAEAILEEAPPGAREPYVRGLVALGLLPLARAGWRDDVDPRGSVSFRPPDGYAHAAAGTPSYLHELRGKPAATVSSYGPNSYWDAHFTAGTPSRVLAAFARELASDEPLLRPADYVRKLTYSRAHITVRSLTEERQEGLSPAAQAARSRSNTPAPAPSPVSSTPPPAPTAVTPAPTAGR